MPKSAFKRCAGYGQLQWWWQWSSDRPAQARKMCSWKWQYLTKPSHTQCVWQNTFLCLYRYTRVPSDLIRCTSSMGENDSSWWPVTWRLYQRCFPWCVYFKFCIYVRKLTASSPWPSGAATGETRTRTWTFTQCTRKLPEFAEITQNNGHGAVQGHSRSPILVPIESSYPVYDFLLVINTNLPPILHHFRNIAIDRSKIAILGYPSCV